MPADEQEAFLNNTSILRVPIFSMPLGILDLAAYMRQKLSNIEIKILDLGKELKRIYLSREKYPSMTVDEFLRSEIDSIDFEPDIVGISILFSSAHHTTMKIAKMSKQRWPNSKLICGGNHSTNYFTHLLKNENVDYVLRGEGEISFTEFVSNMQQGKESLEVRGIIDEKKVAKNDTEVGPIIMDLDEIPMPAYDLLDTEAYRDGVGASVMHSRGCVFKCTFCASHTVNGRDMRYKSNERIIAELDFLIRDHDFKTLFIEDDLFATDKKQFIPLAQKISEQNYPIKIRLPQGLSVSMMNEEMIDGMIAMGIDEASVAIESGSAYTQKNIIKKHVNLDKAKEVLKILRTKKFIFTVNFILGFPGETKELMQESLDYIRSLDVDWVFIFHAIPLLGTEMYDQFVEMGALDQNNFDWDNVRLGRRGFDTVDITSKELTDLIYDTNIDVNFFNNQNMKHGRYEKAIEVFNLYILKQYPFHVVGRYCRALANLALNEKEKANEDLRECVEWISKNSESKRLFERYGKRMPLLIPLLKESFTLVETQTN
jgi:radical SAM superfamily enzyme YgiQ (UPF0313 family)